MTKIIYGTLPTEEAFEQAFNNKCPHGIFSVRNDKRVGNYDYGVAELYDDMQLALDESKRGEVDDPYDGAQWTSDVLSFFGFQWIMSTYLTSYCNKPHVLKTGVPVNHNCYIIPPKALEFERDGNIRRAMGIIEEKRPLREHPGVRVCGNFP